MSRHRSGNYSIAGAVRRPRTATTLVPLAWTGGTPTASSSNRYEWRLHYRASKRICHYGSGGHHSPYALGSCGRFEQRRHPDGASFGWIGSRFCRHHELDKWAIRPQLYPDLQRRYVCPVRYRDLENDVRNRQRNLERGGTNGGKSGQHHNRSDERTPQAATVNTAFGATFQALVKDSGNNPVSGVTVTFTAPAGGASGTFSGSTTATALTAANGVATAPSFTANGRAGSYAVTAIAPGTASAASFSLTNNPGPAAVISASGGTPQSAVVNSLFATALQATVKDASNNPVSGITVTFNAPASGASGTFDGAPTAVAVTTSTGVATAPAFTADGQAGSYTVTAAASGLPASASFSLTNSPAGSTSGNLSGSISTPSGTRSLPPKEPWTGRIGAFFRRELRSQGDSATDQQCPGGGFGSPVHE